MKNAIIRALRTFAQAALGYICVNVVYLMQNPDCSFGEASGAWVGIAVSAIAAGLAAVMNLPHGASKEKAPSGGAAGADSGARTDTNKNEGGEK